MIALDGEVKTVPKNASNLKNRHSGRAQRDPEAKGSSEIASPSPLGSGSACGRPE